LQQWQVLRNGTHSAPNKAHDDHAYRCKGDLMMLRLLSGFATATLLAAAAPSATRAAPQIFFGEHLNISESAPAVGA
jgi:hypothetical protein